MFEIITTVEGRELRIGGLRSLEEANGRAAGYIMAFAHDPRFDLCIEDADGGRTVLHSARNVAWKE